MPALAETQAAFRRAIAGTSPVLPPIVGGPDPALRLAIYRRHYDTSLTRHLFGRFPATGWFVGSDFLAGLAAEFITQAPPAAPCLAEYGKGFPAFLAEHARASEFPWLGPLAEMDWHLGDVAVAVGSEPIPAAALAAVAPMRLPDLTLILQPGLRYVAAPWPVDDLIRIYLADERPERFALAPSEAPIEIRGARGVFSFSRLSKADHAFRRAIAAGATIGAAMGRTDAAGDGIEPAAALTRLFADGLVAGFALSD
jgi:hypothetical protein